MRVVCMYGFVHERLYMCVRVPHVGWYAYRTHLCTYVYIHVWSACGAQVSMTRLFMCRCARVVDVRVWALQCRRTSVYRRACGVREDGLVHLQLSMCCVLCVRRACVYEDTSVPAHLRTCTCV